MRMCHKDLLQKQAAKTKEVAAPVKTPSSRGPFASPAMTTQDSVLSAATTYLFQQHQEQQDWLALATLVAERQQHNDSLQRLQQDLRAVQQMDSLYLPSSNMALLSPLSALVGRNQSSLTGGLLHQSTDWFALEAPRSDAALLLSNHMSTPTNSSFWNQNSHSMTSLIQNNNKTIPQALPVCLARPLDAVKLSDHQSFLRQQIEVFQANEDDVSTHIRGRNKPITLGQVGIRCRHCAHLPIYKRQKGSTYFPANKLGIYQAAQNMSTSHIQCGLCSEMPATIKLEFVRLLEEKGQNCHTGAGRPYWTKTATELGLVDTDEAGIRFIRDLPNGAMVPLE